MLTAHIVNLRCRPRDFVFCGVELCIPQSRGEIWPHQFRTGVCGRLYRSLGIILDTKHLDVALSFVDYIDIVERTCLSGIGTSRYLRQVSFIG